MEEKNLRVEYIDGTPVALAIIGDKIVAKSLAPYRWAPPKKFGTFRFKDWESFEAFVTENSTLGTELWRIPISTDELAVKVIAVIDGHTHYEPGAMRFRAYFYGDTLSDAPHRQAEELAKKIQAPCYEGWPAKPAPYVEDVNGEEADTSPEDKHGDRDEPF